MNRKTSLDPTIVDAASLFDATEAIRDRMGRDKITIDYGKLRETLDTLRRKTGWRPASLNSILVSADPNSEGQQRFGLMLQHSGFEVDRVPYRDAFVSLPPGRSPSETPGRPVTSMASRMAYIAGLMSRWPDSQLLVVTHAFELHAPLIDLARRLPSGKVGLAYFGSLLDYRWRLAGLLDAADGLQFFDLDPISEDIVGVDLGAGARGPRDSQSAGFSRF